VVTLAHVGAKVRGRIHPRERAEIVNEVRLIIVAAGHRDVPPLDLPIPPNQCENALEAEDTREHLRRETDIRGEHLDEAAWTGPDTLGDPSDGLHVGHGLDRADREDYGWMRRGGRG
jgi:hypothetical protein